MNNAPLSVYDHRAVMTTLMQESFMHVIASVTHLCNEMDEAGVMAF